MPTRRRRSKKKSGRSKGQPLATRLLLGTLLVLAAGGILGLKWLQSSPGRFWLADRGVGGGQEWVREHLEQGLREVLVQEGLPADSIAISPAPPEGVSTVEVGATVDLFQLNCAITAMVDERGGRVHRGEKWVRGEDAVLELTLGSKRWPTHRVVARRGPAAREIAPPPPPAGQLAIVIDDWGHNTGSIARRLLDLPAPITLAILPERPASLKILNEAKRAGKQTILHMPMQPGEGASPGPGPMAIKVGMEADEIRSLIRRCLDGLPGVEGLNNHMGSELTKHHREMGVVMEVLTERGLFFLDSLTTPRSVAYAVAQENEIPALRNDLFLDIDTEDPDEIERRLWRLVEKARERGFAVGIGHLQPGTVDALERVLPQLLEGDVQPVFLSDLLRDYVPG